MSKKIIIKGRYILLDSQSFIEDGFVAISGNLIEKTGKVQEIPQDPEYRIYDFGDSIICPGFINTHTHAAMVGMRGMADDLPLKTWLEKYIWPAELKLVDKDFIEKTIPLAIAEMVASGITTFVDMYFFQDKTARIAIDAGIRAVLGEGLIDGPTPAFGSPQKVLEFTESFIKDFEGNEYIFPAVAPHAPYSTSKENLLKSKEIADKYGVPILIHVAETQWEFNEILNRYGAHPFEYLNRIGFLSEKVIAAHSVWVDEKEFEIIKENKVSISHNPESNAKLASGIAPVQEFLDYGINVALGTDGACSNNNLDIIEEMRTASFLQKIKYINPESLSARDVFKMATENGAIAIGLGEKLGTLKPGKWADLVVISLNTPHMNPVFDPYSHLVYVAKASDVKATMVNGKFIYENGEYKTLDIEKVRKDIKEIEDLVKKVIFNGD